jgi:hypothetical protein
MISFFVLTTRIREELIILIIFPDNRSCFYRLLCTGGISEGDPYNPRDNREHACMAFFRDWVARALNIGVVKLLVLVIFAAYLAGACYGITTLKEGLERRRLSKEDSYSIVFYDLEDEYYREFPYRIQVCVIYTIICAWFIA